MIEQTNLEIKGRGEQVVAIPTEIMVDRIVGGRISIEHAILIEGYQKKKDMEDKILTIHYTC